jgi:hypothetical protein
MIITFYKGFHFPVNPDGSHSIFADAGMLVADGGVGQELEGNAYAIEVFVLSLFSPFFCEFGNCVDTKVVPRV